MDIVSSTLPLKQLHRVYGSISFHQNVHAITPAITAVMTYIFYRQKFSRRTSASLLLLILGAGLATYHDFPITALSIVVVCLKGALSGFKSITTSYLQTRCSAVRFDALELLFWMSLLAALKALFMAWSTEEISVLWNGAYANKGLLGMCVVYMRLLLSITITFPFNVISFMAHKALGPVTIKVDENIMTGFTVVVRGIRDANHRLVHMLGKKTREKHAKKIPYRFHHSSHPWLLTINAQNLITDVSD
ncbi:MAG: UAA transporter [Cirrosporium novae-zelandiae]|nr:MAG: UAA transporter [Cirrosporium novae-zelandiae]